jgi:putative acetyltransferase
MVIVPGDFENPQLLALLHVHLAGMHANSPPGSNNAFDLSGLKALDISVYTAWREDGLLGMAALRQLDAVTGEIKSMRTDPAHLHKGVAAALFNHMLNIQGGAAIGA